MPARLGKCRGGHARLHSGPRHKWTTPASKIESSAGTVGVALLFAQHAIEPRAEESANDLGVDECGVVVRIKSRATDTADADLRLHRTGSVQHLHERSGACRRGSGRGAIWLTAAPGAATCADLTEAARLNQGEGCISINVARKNERWRAGAQDLLVSRNNLVARQACDTLGGSGEGSTVGGLWCVERRRERVNGATSWARMRLLDGGESQRLQSFYVGFRDARGECNLGHQIKDASEARDRCASAHGEALPARLRANRCTEQLARLNESVGVVVLGPLREEARQQG